MKVENRILVLVKPFIGEGDENTGGDAAAVAAAAAAAAAGTSSNVVNIKETSEFKDAVAAALLASDNDTKGLQSKNEELLSKLAEAKTKIKTFDGIDPDEAKKIMEAINQSEETKLIAEGKIDEVIAKRTDTIRQKYLDDISGLNDGITKANEERDGFRNLLDNKTIGDEIQLACVKHGVLPNAFEDVKSRAADIFKISRETNDIESRLPNGEFRKTTDEMLMTPDRFVESLKTLVPHYWPTSQGSGSQGNNFGNLSESDAMAKLVEASQGANGKIDMDKYRAARKNMSTNTSYTGRG